MGMDRRQLLDGIGSMSVFGELADDVVLACSDIQTGNLSPEGRATLRKALAMVEALCLFEEPAVLSPASLDSMSGPSAVSETVERLRPGATSAEMQAHLKAVANDLNNILGDHRDVDAVFRVQEFFGHLADGMLASSELLLRPHVREVPWMTTAFSY